MVKGHIPLGILKKRLVKLSELVARRSRAGESLGGVRKPKTKKTHRKSKKSKKK